MHWDKLDQRRFPSSVDALPEVVGCHFGTMARRVFPQIDAAWHMMHPSCYQKDVDTPISTFTGAWKILCVHEVLIKTHRPGGRSHGKW